MDQILLEEALRTGSTLDALKILVQAKVVQGYDREKLAQELTDFALDLRSGNRENDEGLTFEVLDILTGWYTPHMKK